MLKLLAVTATIGLMLLSTSYAAQREHRAGQPGYTPGGGVTVSPGGRGGRNVKSKVVKVRPAPTVNSSSNVRDHRSVPKW